MVISGDFFFGALSNKLRLKKRESWRYQKNMLKNAYLGPNIGFDTEENELSEVGCAAGYQLYFYPLAVNPAGFS